MNLRNIHDFLLGTLRGRLILSVAVVHAVMMTLFILDLTVRQRTMLLDQQEEDATALSQSLATSAAGWLAADDIAGLQELVEAQRRYPELIFAILVDKSGHILAHTDKSRNGQFLLDLPVEVRQSVISKTPTLVDIAAPAIIGVRHVGWARVGIGQKAASKKLSKITTNGVLYALAAILIGSVIAWIMGRRITLRLYAVQNTINKVKRGDRIARSSIAGVDEAASIANEFNLLLNELDEQGAALVEREKEYRMLLRNIRVAVVVHGPNTQILMSNPMAQELLGLSEEQMLGKAAIDPAWRFLREDGSNMPLEEFPVNRTLANRRPIKDLIVGLRRPDKDATTWTLVNTELILNEQGEISEVIVTFVDITERKQAEIEKEQFYTFFQTASDIMAIADPNGAFLKTNPACTEILGYSDAELLAKPFIDFVHPDDRRSTLDEMTRQQQIGSSMNFENRYLCKDGSIRWLSWRATFNKNEGITFAIARDFTDSKRMDDALKKSEKEFHLLAESMPQIVWVTRPDGWNIYFNHQWVDYTGLTLEESYGHGWNKPFHPDDQKRAWDAWQNATQYGATYSLECRLRRADGTYKWWLIRGVPVLDTQGSILKWFGTCTDIDELKQVEDKVARYRDHLEELVKQRTTEVERKNAELEKMNKIFVGRELRMAELKQRIKDLEKHSL